MRHQLLRPSCLIILLSLVSQMTFIALLPVNGLSRLSACNNIIVIRFYLQLIRRFQYLSAQTFVQQHKLMKWCPSPGCTFAVEANSTRGVPVMCNCGYRFCFGCSSPAHEPVSCQYFKLWIKKCEDDSETAHWIHANTKQCTKCKAVIEKSGGCNHMVSALRCMRL